MAPDVATVGTLSGVGDGRQPNSDHGFRFEQPEGWRWSEAPLI
jgi:hypothetical protein